MKKMSLILILLGIFFFGIGVLCLKSSVSVAPSEEAKANDKRIVKNPDGTFGLEYYWPYPGWRQFGTRNDFNTFEEAHQRLNQIKERAGEPVQQGPINP